MTKSHSLCSCPLDHFMSNVYSIASLSRQPITFLCACLPAYIIMVYRGGDRIWKARPWNVPGMMNVEKRANNLIITRPHCRTGLKLIYSLPSHSNAPYGSLSACSENENTLKLQRCRPRIGWNGVKCSIGSVYRPLLEVPRWRSTAAIDCVLQRVSVLVQIATENRNCRFRTQRRIAGKCALRPDLVSVSAPFGAQWPLMGSDRRYAGWDACVLWIEGRPSRLAFYNIPLNRQIDVFNNAPPNVHYPHSYCWLHISDNHRYWRFVKTCWRQPFVYGNWFDFSFVFCV